MSHEDADDASACPLGGKCLFDGGCMKHGHTRCEPQYKAAARGAALARTSEDTTAYEE